MIFVTFWENIWNGLINFFESVGEFFMTKNEQGLNMLTRIIIAIAVLVLGVILIKLFIAILKKVSGIKKGIALDMSAKSFFIGALKIALYFVLAFFIVQILGINITGAVGILSAVTVALGLALQDIIGMFASGLLIFNVKNFHTGDYIKVCNSFGTEEGKVMRISLLYTTLLNVEGQQIHIPNNNITKANVTNYTTHPSRRGVILITLTHDNDSDDVIKVFKSVAEECETVLKDPACFSYINSFNTLGVEYALRFYTENDKYWDTLFVLRKKLYETIKEHGYKIAASNAIVLDGNKEEE